MRIIDYIPNTGWIVQSGPDINPKPPDYFNGFPIPGTTQLKVVNAGPAMGGALVTNKRKVPISPDGALLNFVGLDVDVFISSEDLPFLGRLEIDVNICLVPGQVFMLGTQLNMSTGIWQIDPAWTDTTCKPTVIANEWTHISIRHFLDSVKSKGSTLSLQWDDEDKYDVPSNLQQVPTKALKWDKVAAVQAQTETLIAGEVTVIYDNWELSWDSVPF